MSAIPTTPSGRATPRYSAIPTPSSRSVSGIPTPGRSVSSRSTTGTPLPTSSTASRAGQHDTDAMRALSDAIRANDPAQHRATPDLLIPNTNGTDASGRRSVAGGRYSSRASTSSATSSVSGFDKSTTTVYRPKTPSSAVSTSFSSRTSATPRSSVASSRPASRQSDVFRASSRQGYAPPLPGPKALDLGDPVRIDSLGVDGTIQFLGEADFKEGLWAGVELSPQYAGKGKNDGSVAGVRYFSCAPNCGVFVAPAKLTPLNTRSDSVASGRFTPVSGRETPSLKPRGTTTGRAPPPSNTPFKTPEPPRFAPGSRASKYVGLTAQQLREQGQEPSRTGSVSPTRAGNKSPTRSSMHTTPKATSRPSVSGLVGPTPRRSIGGPSSMATPRAIPKSSVNRTKSPVPEMPSAASTFSFLNRSPSRSSRPGSGAGAFAKPITPSGTSQTSSDTLIHDDHTSDAGTASAEGSALHANAKAIEDKIARLMMSSGSSLMDESEIAMVSPTSSSEHNHTLLPAADVTSYSNGSGIADKLEKSYMRIAELEMALEMEKSRGKAGSSSIPSVPAVSEADSSSLVEENARLAARISSLENEISTRVDAARDEAEQLNSQLRDSHDTLETLRSDLDARAKLSKEIEGEKAKLQEELSNIRSERVKIEEEMEKVKMESKTVSEERVKLEGELTGLKGELERTKTELDSDRRSLAFQVDELRLAGQETIALYEERINDAREDRHQLEETIRSLEEQVRLQALPISSAELTARATTAAQIDNETLTEQVAHLQSRIGNLEDQLQDARGEAESREQAYQARMVRFRESEATLKSELDLTKRDMERVGALESEARERVQSVSAALQESDAALEDARAEIELLRSDMAVLEAAKGPDDLVEPSAPASELQAQLEEERKRRADVASAHDQLQKELTSLKSESAELSTKFNDVQHASQEQLERISEMSRLLEQRTRELETARLSSSKGPGGDARSELTTLRDQVTGYKHMMNELQKENGQLTSSMKVLEKDNQQLTAECDQLRESLEKLEEEFEQKILAEHGSPDPEANGSPLLQDVATLRQALKDSQKRHEHEMDQMRKKLADATLEHRKEINKLTNDVTDLEQLLEARIYKEDELEAQIEQLRSDLKKAQKRKNRPSNTGSAHSTIETATDGEVVCEACGKPGHDIATCEEVFNGYTSKKSANGNARSSLGSSSVEENNGLWCEDCESHDHITSECPFSQDVF